jgi:hypothetical protein
MRYTITYTFLLLFACTSPQTNELKNNSTNLLNTSTITCPKCKYSKTLLMPTEACQIKYTCQKCDTTLFPADEDCCVFCTYGDKKCPSMQND